jgi:hypothetical protein
LTDRRRWRIIHAANTDQFGRDSRDDDEERSRINVSPHHQRPTKYPWPGAASGFTVVLGLAVIVVIGFLLIANPFANDADEPTPTSMSGANIQGL